MAGNELYNFTSITPLDRPCQGMECSIGGKTDIGECNFLSEVMKNSWPTAWNDLEFSVLFFLWKIEGGRGALLHLDHFGSQT